MSITAWKDSLYCNLGVEGKILFSGLISFQIIYKHLNHETILKHWSIVNEHLHSINNVKDPAASDITVQNTTQSCTFTCLVILCLSWSHKYFIRFIGKIKACDLHLIYCPLYSQGSERGTVITFIIIFSSSTFSCCFNTGCKHITEAVTLTLEQLESTHLSPWHSTLFHSPSATFNRNRINQHGVLKNNSSPLHVSSHRIRSSKIRSKQASALTLISFQHFVNTFTLIFTLIFCYPQSKSNFTFLVTEVSHKVWDNGYLKRWKLNISASVVDLQSLLDMIRVYEEPDWSLANLRTCLFFLSCSI